jgi:hypothetical protein
MLDLDKVKNFTEDKRRSRFICLMYSYLLLLVILVSFRAFLHLYFYDPVSNYQEVILTYLYGFVFDFRAISFILFPTIIVTFIPYIFMHNQFVPRFFLAFQFIFILFYFIFCVFDFTVFDLTKIRVGGSDEKLSELFGGMHQYWQYALTNYSFVLILMAVILLSLTVILILEFIKRKWLYKGQYELVFFPFRFERSLFILIAICIIYFKLGSKPLLNKDTIIYDQNAYLSQIMMNPLSNCLEKLINR